ncbi:MAG: hypothetical protein ACR2IF_06335 [Terriglobales bacterium]
MRVLRVLCCALLLAAMVAAQTQSSSQDPSQEQPSGQAPVNPLDQAKPAQSVTQQPGVTPQQGGETRASKPSTFNAGEGAGTGQDQELGEVRMMTRYTQVNGAPEGLQRSFHNDGSNNLAEFNYFLDRNFFSTGRRFQFLTMYRGTDDTSIDPERNSLQKTYFRIYGSRDEYLFGDALVNYSRLSFNQNIKGLSASWKLNKKWKLSTVGGVFIDRWGSLFKEQPGDCYPPASLPVGATFTPNPSPQCGRPFAAAVTGARLEYAFARDSALGLNTSTSDDLTFTRQPQPFGTAPDPATNRVGSIDFKYSAKGLRMEGEWAYSATNFDRRLGTCVPIAGAPCDPRVPTPGLGVQTDWGARYDATYRWHKLSFRGSYVRYEPAFASMNARQIADLQDALFRVSYEATPWLTVDGTARRTNDDLKQQNQYEKILWGPEGRFIFHDLAFYRRAVIEVGYRHRIIGGETPVLPASGLVAGCVPNGAGMICADRYVRTPYAEISIPLHTTFFTVGYERRQQVDNLAVASTSNTDRIYGALRGIYDLGGWHLNPTMRYEFERQGTRPNLANVLPGNTPSAVDLLLLRETNRLITAGLFVEAPRWFILELGYRENSATTLAGYYRPSYKAALTYKIANDENKTLIFSFERNNNFYYTAPPLGGVATTTLYPPGGVYPLVNPQNFDERIAGVTFVYKFGKRGR